MSDLIICERQDLVDVADAIRSANESETLLALSAMPNCIYNIQERITNAKEAIKSALRKKGATVSDDAQLEDFATLILRLQLSNDIELPDYWLSHLSSKVNECNAALDEAGDDAVAFWFFTDSHNKYNSGYTGRLLRYMADATGVYRVVNGGDILDYQNSQDEITALYDAFTSDVVDYFDDIMLVKGNHDLNPYGTPILTDAEYYEQFFSPMAKYGADGKTYYYVDDDTLKIRFLVVDSRETSIAYSISNGDDTEKAYAQAEVQWIYDTLNSTPSGYTVIAISHVMWWGASQFPQGSAVIGSSSMSQLCTVLNAYNNRASGTEWGIAYNFANAKGTASYLQTGHTHIDYSQVISGILTVSTAADSYQYANNRPDNIVHTLGTTTENVIDLVIVKPSDGTVKTIRIGAGENRLFNYSGTKGQVCNVENNLSNCTTNNNATTAIGTYSATLTASGDKTFLVSPTLWMHGYDMTSNYVSVSEDKMTATISLPNVAGDIEILAACGSIPCTGVTLSKSSHKGFEGDTFTLTATVTPEDTTDELVWSTTNESVATVIDGVVELVSIGNATITATCGNKSASCSVKVSEVPNYTNLVPTSIAWLEDGIYNGIGYKDGVYYSTSSLNTDANYTSTGLIEIAADASGGTSSIYIKGCEITSESHCRLSIFNSSKELEAQVNAFLSSTQWATVTSLGDNYYRIDMVNLKSGLGFTNTSFYVAFSLKGIGEDLVVTVGEPIDGSDEPTTTTHSIINNLTNVINSNDATSAIDGSSYSATLTANSGYTLSSVEITMAGAMISSDYYDMNTGAINIPNVYGDIVITAVATVSESANYTNLVPTSIAWLESGIYNGIGYKDGVYYSSSSLNSDADYTSTGLIDMTADSSGNTTSLYLKGCTINTESHCRITLFKNDKTIEQQVNAFLTVTDKFFKVTELGTNYYRIDFQNLKGSYGLANSSFYVSFSVKGSGSNLIVTAGEEIV